MATLITVLITSSLVGLLFGAGGYFTGYRDAQSEKEGM